MNCCLLCRSIQQQLSNFSCQQAELKTSPLNFYSPFVPVFCLPATELFSFPNFTPFLSANWTLFSGTAIWRNSFELKESKSNGKRSAPALQSSPINFGLLVWGTPFRTKENEIFWDSENLIKGGHRMRNHPTDWTRLRLQPPETPPRNAVLLRKYVPNSNKLKIMVVGKGGAGFVLTLVWMEIQWRVPLQAPNFFARQWWLSFTTKMGK